MIRPNQGVSIPSRLAPPEVIQSSDGGIVAAIRKLAIRYSSRSASSFKPVKKKALDLTSGTFKWGTSGTSKWPGGGGRGNGIIKGKSKKTQQQQGRYITFSLKATLCILASLVCSKVFKRSNYLSNWSRLAHQIHDPGAKR